MSRKNTTAQRLNDIPYEKRICRIEHYPTSLETPHTGIPSQTGPTVEQEVNAIADAGTQIWSAAAFTGRGIPLWPSKIMEPSPDANPALITKFLDKAHEKGMLVESYYPFIFTRALTTKQPDWLIKMLDDGDVPVWNEGWFCWNSPYRDWLPEYLNEMLDYFDFDGIYFDDMNWGSHSDAEQRRTGGCKCTYCCNLYLKETNKELPVKVDMNSIEFRRYINWRYEKFNESLEHVANNIYSKHPDINIGWNYYGRPYGMDDIGWKTAHPLNPLPETTQFFMEAGLDNLGTSFPAKLLRAAGSSFGYFYSAQRTSPGVGPTPYPEPISATVAAISAVVKGGASITVGLDAGDHTYDGDTLKSVFSEIMKLQPYVGGESVKHLAFHVSQQTRDFKYLENLDRFWAQLRGSHEILKRSHILTEVMFDKQLTYKNLREYKVLFLSNSACLSDQQTEDIRRFVSDGGTLIATNETSLYDELGRKRDNFALADVLGIDYQNTIPLESDSSDDYELQMKNSQSNVYVPQTSHLKNQLGYIVAFAGHTTNFTKRNDSDVLYTKSKLRWKQNPKNPQAPIPPLTQFYAHCNYDSGLPAVTCKVYGKGKAYYICGDVGDGYNRTPLPQVKTFLSDILNSAHSDIELTAPGVIELSVFLRKPGQLMVHLLNNPLVFVPWEMPKEEISNYFRIEELLPVHDVTIRFNGTFEETVKSARLPFTNTDLKVTHNPTTIRIPVIDIEEVVLVELEDPASKG